MNPNWKPVIAIVAAGILMIGAQFAGKVLANVTEDVKPPVTLEMVAEIHKRRAEETIKPDDAPTLKTPRQKLCAELIRNIKRAYYRDDNRSSYESRLNLAATIQIYNGVNGRDFCHKLVFKILEDAQDGK